MKKSISVNFLQTQRSVSISRYVQLKSKYNKKKCIIQSKGLLVFRNIFPIGLRNKFFSIFPRCNPRVKCLEVPSTH